jgi:hypothetical protein
MMELFFMSGFIYIWYDRKHKRYYVGSHWGSPDDGYICSSNWMRDAYHRRPEDFKRRVISHVITNRKKLFEEEQRYLQMIKVEEIGKRYYNLIRRTDHHWLNNPDSAKSVAEKISKTLTGRKLSEETKTKLSNINKGRTLSEDHKSKIGDAHRGKSISAEQRQVLSEINMGKKQSDTVRKKMSDAHKARYENGTPQTEESKKKMSDYARNRTEEHRQKISENNKRLIAEGRIGMKGRKHSPETIKKMSDARKAHYASIK